MSTATEPFGTEWSRRKLDMPRRRRELTAYIDRWLPELREMEPGLVLDVGCGPGDFLDLCRDMGHDVLGIDAPDGEGGMGDAYLEECRKECERIGVKVWRANGPDDERLQRQGIAALVNYRGSIEQIYQEHMSGDPHHKHHDCRLLDWNASAAVPLRESMAEWPWLLRHGGILLIHANGTKSTDAWYDETIRAAADAAGLELVEQQGLLLHKWVKP